MHEGTVIHGQIKKNTSLLSEKAIKDLYEKYPSFALRSHFGFVLSEDSWGREGNIFHGDRSFWGKDPDAGGCCWWD